MVRDKHQRKEEHAETQDEGGRPFAGDRWENATWNAWCNVSRKFKKRMSDPVAKTTAHLDSTYYFLSLRNFLHPTPRRTVLPFSFLPFSFHSFPFVPKKRTLVWAERPLALDLQADLGNLKRVGYSLSNTRRCERA